MKRIKPIPLIALAVYVVFISWRLYFYAYRNNVRYVMREASYNIIPFKTIVNYLTKSQHIEFDIWIYNLAGNIVAFVPLGLLSAAAFPGLRKLKYIAGISLMLIFTAELLQFVTRRGVFDVDDLILNTLGSILGFGFYKLIDRFFNRGEKGNGHKSI